jgi:hypothetical protein
MGTGSPCIAIIFGDAYRAASQLKVVYFLECVARYRYAKKRSDNDNNHARKTECRPLPTK